jgi:hypothetical protein
MKKLLFVALMTSPLICADAVKLPNARRVLVNRFEDIKTLLIELKRNHTAIFNELCKTVLSCRKKTKCYVNFSDLSATEKLIQSITGNEFILWNEKGVVHPDVRNIIASACKVQGSSFSIN